MQAVDPGVMTFQVGPEHTQPPGELFQAAIVDGGLAFTQVVHQQVTDGAAGKLVPFDQLLWRALASSAQLTQPVRRGRAEYPGRAQRPVAGGAVSRGGTMHAGLGIQQLKEIAERDVGEHAALGGHHDRGPLHRVIAGRGGRGHARIAVAYRPQPCQSLAVAACGHGAGKVSVPAAARRQPGQRGPHHVSGDHRDQCRSQPAGAARARDVPAARPPGGQLPPADPGLLGAAGQPSLLPAVTVLPFQPVQQHDLPAMAPARGTAAQQILHLVPAPPGGRPVRRRRPRREAGPRGPVTREPGRRGRPRRAGHHRPSPNRTSSDSGRYPGAGDGRARSRAWRTCPA